MGEQRSQHRVLWDEFEFDVGRRELRRRGIRIRLQNVPFQVLELLLERPGELILREEFHKRIWNGYSYGDFDHSLNNAINKLRGALNDPARHPHYIETIPLVGYRFTAAVERTQPPLAPKVRIVVLPLARLGGECADEYFCDGLTDEIIGHLGRLNPLRLGVIARTSSMRYKGSAAGAAQIGHELGVDYILEGSGQYDGKRVHVNLRLIDVRDETQLWSETYERGKADVFQLLQEVAQRVVESLSIEIVPARTAPRTLPPAFAEAHEEYLKGRYQAHKRTEQGFLAAIEHFNEALRNDPQFAAAHAGLASSYMLLGNHDLRPPTETFPAARSATSRALAIDPTSSEAHSAAMFISAFYDWDFSAAERQYESALARGAISADLHYYHGFYLPALRRFDDAVAEMYRALRLDPLFPALNANLCFALYLAGRYDQAVARGRQAVTVEPGFWLTRIRLGRALLEAGCNQEALCEHEEALRLSGGPPVHRILLAYACARVGDRARARQLLAEVLQAPAETYRAPYFLAELYAALGDRDAAFSWLEKSMEIRSTWLVYAQVEPALAPLRSDARFASLVHTLGLDAS